MQINEDDLNDLAIERKSDTITCIWQETQRKTEEWERFIVDKRREMDSGVPWLEVVGMGKL